MNRTRALLLALGTLVVPARAQEQEPPGPGLPLAFGLELSGGELVIPADRPDQHAPIGVTGDHPVEDGAWTFSYRYTQSEGEGLLEGDSEIGYQDLFLDGFSEAPADFTIGAHLFSALYGYDDRLSLLLDVPWTSREKDVRTAAGGDYTTRVIGLGDVRLTALYALERRGREQFHLDLGISLPTGSTDVKDETATSLGQSVNLPYDMQLGSGTVDLHPGLTYFRLDEDTSYGAQATQSVRLGENSDGYTLGNTTRVTAWVARGFREDLSGSLRLEFLHQAPIEGRDQRLDPSFDPSADPDNYGGDRLDVFVGLNYTQPGGHRFAGEIGGPIFQDLNGPQVETDLLYLFGWQFSF